MGNKPSYLGLLNAIAVAEAQAHEYLHVWADATPSEDVRQVLLTVAAREGEHGMSFAKRINELGYSVREKDDPRFAKQMEIADADCSDLEKFEALGVGRLDSGDKPDFFDDIFKDHSIDIATGALMGRYIAEERDSGRLLRCCHEQLKSRANGGVVTGDRLAVVDAKIDALCAVVTDLHEMVVAQAGVGGNGNGKARSKTRA